MNEVQKENSENTLILQLDSNSLDLAIKKTEKLKTLLLEVKELLRDITATNMPTIQEPNKDVGFNRKILGL